MNSKPNLNRSSYVVLMALLWSLASQTAFAGLKLEGQYKGDTNNWHDVNLLHWQELDYIPCRLRFDLAQGNNQTITINFEHVNGAVPGVQNLFNFTSSSNIVITAGPTLSAPPAAGTWSYTFTVNVLDNNTGYLWFYARLAAGAHLNTGSSLALSGKPSSMGTLQIHKPSAAPGAPDLMVVKSGPASAKPGDIITYSLTYSNQASASHQATGVQLSDVLPPEVTVLTETIPGGGLLVGNTIYWDLPDLDLGAGGQFTFQVQVNATTPYSHSFANFSQILSAEDDQNYADNTSTLVTKTVDCAQPTVLLAPLAAARCPGDAITFVATVNGTGPLGYQWRKDGVAINGATTTLLTLSPISPADAGAYSIVVSNVCGITTSASAILTVNTNASVAAMESQSRCPGEAVSFTAQAAGTGPFHYRWSKDGVTLAETNSSLTIPAVTVSDSGLYCVEVTGACGSVVSTCASLTVNTPVSGTQLISLVKCPGDSATFETAASGTGPYTYLWLKNGVALAETNNSLTLAPVTGSDAGSYSVVVSGACGSVTNSATLTVNENVIVVSEPVSLTNCPGTTAAFSVAATGSALSYQWFKGGDALAGQTADSLVLNNVTAADAGLYSVTVSGSCGEPISRSASLTVLENVIVVSEPVSLTNCPGSSARFAVTATGSGLSYQWFKGGSALAGQTADSLVLNNVTAADAGVYSVTVSGTCGEPVSAVATLTVNENLSISVVPAAATNCPSTVATFSIAASGTGLQYQWYKNGMLLPDQTNGSLVINGVSAADVGTYSVVASGICGNAATNSATLTVNENVNVVSDPISLTNCPGSSATFAVSASGSGLSYQWFKGGDALAGQTANSLVLNNVTAADAGIYAVTVSGSCGEPVSRSASLTVLENVIVASEPVSLTNCPGTGASFRVVATGSGLSYQWYHGTSQLVGETGSTLKLLEVTASDAGLYSVTVSGTCGEPVSRSASLTVLENVNVVSDPISLTNCPGSSATFAVSASGSGLSYQWFKGGDALAGQTANSLVLNHVAAADAGIYTVTVSGSCGEPVSRSASLTILENVIVVTDPVSLTNCPGTAASFSVAATGTGLSYQWFKGSQALAGQTANTLVLNNVSAADAGAYTVTVSGTCGEAVSRSASLTVLENVIVVTDPVSLTNCPGTAASFSVAATGTGLSYQWFKGSQALAGQTANTLVLNNITAADAGIYTVTVSGVCGESVSRLASLTVNDTIVISVVPHNATNCAGTTATFDVAASGTGLKYQWFRNGAILPGQTGGSLVLNNVTAADAGTYSVVASGICGNSATNSATLTVLESLTVVSAPANLTNCPGSSATFAVSASGAGVSYQWYKGMSAVASQTGQSLVLNNVTPADAGIYSVVISGVCDSVVRSATLTVGNNVSLSPLASLLRNPGDTAVFSSVASGSGPFTYVWKKDGTILAGQTGASLTLTNLTVADAGLYSVEVAGHCGMAVQSATLTINQPPTVSIVNPTNGTQFVFPQGIPILAHASDPDGTISSVELFQGGTKLTDCYVEPYAFFWTTAPVGTHQLTARATDNLGLAATSAPVDVTVLDRPPIAAGPIQLNRQNGLFEQSVTISNPTPYAFTQVRIWIYDLTAETRVWNATGTNDGIPYIDYALPIAGGASGTFTIKYYIPSRIPPVPVLVPELLGTDYGDALLPPPAPMISSLIRLPDGAIALQFNGSANTTYYVQYCSALGGVWKTAASPILGSGATAQWLDNGAPNTESHPATQVHRFYRLVAVPQ